MILVTKRLKGNFLSVYWSLERFNTTVKIPNSSWFSKNSQGIYIHLGKWLFTIINDRRH